VGEDLPASALVSVQVQRAMLQAGPKRVSQVLLGLIWPTEQSDGRLLIDVLQLLAAQPAALRKAARDPNLLRLPFPENFSDPLRVRAPAGLRAARGRSAP
jgi:hypothetical protein